jgi:nickel-type superoxide dismutase maturation protease
MKRLILIRRVVGQSMSPSLKPGQLIIGLYLGKPKVGELIIFRHKGLEKIKRIDKIEHESFFVIGDNPQQSTDSRQFGPINSSQVLARIVWPRR